MQPTNESKNPRRPSGRKSAGRCASGWGYKRTAGFLLLAALLLPAVAARAAESDVVAKGDGFTLTTRYVELFRAFVESGRFVSKKEEYPKAAVNLLLFALEGQALGLLPEKGVSFAGSGPPPLPAQLDLFQAYTKKLIKDYQVSEQVLESYYRSHSEVRDRELNEALKEEIRQRIRAAKSGELIRNELKRLWRKYHVELLVEQEGQEG